MLTHTYTHTHTVHTDTHTDAGQISGGGSGVTVSDRRGESSDWLRQLVGGSRRIASLVGVK